MSSRLLLLDTASLYYRAFYGLPDSLKSPDGQVVNAVRGMVGFVASLLEEYEPDALVACWDESWRPSWRVALVSSYKAHRVAADGSEDTPADLVDQIPLVRQALDLLGIAVMGAKDYEADDVIATLAASWPGPVDIVTGDRDLLQLVDDDQPVRVRYTARGVSKLTAFDSEAVYAKYGVEPRHYPVLAALRGDPSDGIAGLSGIGEKTAASLVAQYGAVEEILAAAGDDTTHMRPKIRAVLRENGNALRAMHQIIRLNDEVELPAVRSLAETPIANEEQWESFAQRWGLGQPAARARAARSKYQASSSAE